MTSETETGDENDVAALQKKLSRLRRKLKAARAELEALSGAVPKVSPLAPAAVPDLPPVTGVRFATAAAGVKYAGRPDVMLAEIAPGSSIAGVFTRSATRAAPVLDCQQKLAGLASDGAEGGDVDKGFAILVNSGNANAFTGAIGVQAVRTATGTVARALSIPEGHVFSASTGVIGEALPAEKITDAVAGLCGSLSAESAADAARAIMTTDTYKKGAAASAAIGDAAVRVVGFAKGSGMIAPDMATMLVFIFTDAAIAQADLQAMVTRLNKGSFNSITVDSDTSTSDTVLVVATGKSGVRIGKTGTKSNRAFAAALGKVMLSLAHQVVRDGEGATKFLTVHVSGAATARDARLAARAIANSPLVKTAAAGEDPNWGRIVMAIGKSGARADRDRLAIWFGDIVVAENGLVSPQYTEAEGAAYMKAQDLDIRVDLGLGRHETTVWTCDLTKQYITINADYRS